MISKVKYSKDLGSTINYIINSQKEAHIVLHKGIYCTNNTKQIIRDFELQAQMRPNLKTKAIHIPLSFHINDKEFVDKYGDQIIKDWISQMESHGYRFDQFIIARHHDKDHKNPHFHFMGNLVMNDGSRANIANIGLAAKQTSKAITEKWRLTPANHRKVFTPIRNKDSPTFTPHSHRQKVCTYYNTEQITNHKNGSVLFDLLLSQPTISYGGGSCTSPQKDKEKDKKKKRKKR